MLRSNHTAALLVQPESPALAGVLRAVRATVTRDAEQIAVVLRALDAFNDCKLCPACEEKFISVYMPICGHPLCSACKDLLSRAELSGHVACPTCSVLLRPLDWLNIHTSPHSSVSIDVDDVRAGSPVSGMPMAAARSHLLNRCIHDAASTPVAASPPVAPPLAAPLPGAASAATAPAFTADAAVAVQPPASDASAYAAGLNRESSRAALRSTEILPAVHRATARVPFYAPSITNGLAYIYSGVTVSSTPSEANLAIDGDETSATVVMRAGRGTASHVRATSASAEAGPLAISQPAESTYTQVFHRSVRVQAQRRVSSCSTPQ